jgi:hypothetical protein
MTASCAFGLPTTATHRPNYARSGKAVRRSNNAALMSLSGHLRRFELPPSMSAMPPIATEDDSPRFE